MSDQRPLPAVDETLRRAPLVFVDSLTDPVLEASDVHHLVRVRRIAVGGALNLGDGKGSWVPALLTSTAGAVEPTGEPVTLAPPTTTIRVGFVPTKGARPERVVQALTELGVDRMEIVVSERSVVSYNTDRAERLLRKLVATVREASQQSRQTFLPVVSGPSPISEFLASEAGSWLCDPSGDPIRTRVSPASPVLSVAIGPEGGWSDAELGLADSVALPGRILRSETAAVAAGVVLAAVRDFG